MNSRRECTFRLDKDLYERIRNATFLLRVSKQQAMQEGIEMWLRKAEPKARKVKLT